jgi:hypothetical protein
MLIMVVWTQMDDYDSPTVLNVQSVAGMQSSKQKEYLVSYCTLLLIHE